MSEATRPAASPDRLEVDVLFISYNRPEYTAMSLPSLLESAVGHARVWIWHNGDDQATLEVVRGFKNHPAVFQYRESPENVGLYPPIAWVMQEGKGAFVSKVDDDCLLPSDWIPHLKRASEVNPNVAVLGCWRFQDEDVREDLLARKLVSLEEFQVLQNLWVEGSGFLMRRSALEAVGGMREQEQLPRLFRRIGCAGFINGWAYPFVRQDHMDDPRSPNTGLKSTSDLTANLPLSAIRTGVATLEEWTAQLRHSAWIVQAASVDCRWYSGWKGRLRRLLLWVSRERVSRAGLWGPISRAARRAVESTVGQPESGSCSIES